MENPNTGILKRAPIGFSWTTLFWQCLPALFRGDFKGFIIQLLLDGFLLVPVVIFPFIYNKLYIEKLLEKGFKVKDVEGESFENAKKRLGINLPMLVPGTVIGRITDRNTESQRSGSWESTRAGQTWLILCLIAAIVVFILSMWGVFHGHSSVVNIRRAIPVTEDLSVPASAPSPANHAVAGVNRVPGADLIEPMASSPQPPTARMFYSVVGIAPGDGLNVRIGPGTRYATIARLSNGFGGIEIIGEAVVSDATEWVKIAFREETGWVNKLYLKAE